MLFTGLWMARLILLGGHLPVAHRRHVGGLGLGFFGAKEALALALLIFAVQFASPDWEFIALVTLNAIVI